MGTITPNISIYIPAAGEELYDQSFLAGMINVDQHDHSGPPNKGVPIAASGIVDGAVTYKKLSANVADNTTGIGTMGTLGANQLSLLGILKSIYELSLSPGGNGYLVQVTGSSAVRTLTGTANQVAITNGDGSVGNPVFSIAPPLLIPTNPAAQLYITTPITNPASVSTGYIIPFDTVGYDRAGNYPSPPYSNFTAGVSGLYEFDVHFSVSGLTGANTDLAIDLVCSSGEIQHGWRGNVSSLVPPDSMPVNIQFGGLFNMTAAQTVHVLLTVPVGSTTALQINGGAKSTGPTSFSGALLS